MSFFLAIITQKDQFSHQVIPNLIIKYYKQYKKFIQYIKRMIIFLIPLMDENAYIQVTQQEEQSPACRSLSITGSKHHSSLPHSSLFLKLSCMMKNYCQTLSKKGSQVKHQGRCLDLGQKVNASWFHSEFEHPQISFPP